MNYHVEHLATFSTLLPSQQQITPKVALQRLFAMEKTSGIWTQKMTIQIEDSHMLIYDRESNDIVENFPVLNINQPVAFSHSNHIYDNILMFTVQHPKETEGELHIFQCVSEYAQRIADDLNKWMSKHGNNNQINNNDFIKSNKNSRQTQQSAFKVKDAVSVFNAIAAQREKKTSQTVNSSPHRNDPPSPGVQNYREQDLGSLTTSSSMELRDQTKNASNDSGNSLNNNNTSSNQSINLSNSNNDNNLINFHRNIYEPPLTIEKYVTILNHCFDEIERFSLRLQHAAAAYKELQLRNFKRKEKGGLNGGDGMIAIRARGPSEEDYFEILSKFKLSFNLLAKLKGYIHDPNAPELVHFLFTPLAIIIEAAKNNPNVPIDATAVEMPFLHHEAIDLLSNCCTSKEFDLWQSLGPNWTQVRHVKNTPKFPIYQPTFIDGWAPSITEPELIGFTPTSEQLEHHQSIQKQHNLQYNNSHRSNKGISNQFNNFSDNEEHDEQHPDPLSNTSNHNFFPYTRLSPSHKDTYLIHESIEMEQKNFLNELQHRNAKILRVLYPRTANNDKELTVFRWEILELLDNSRNWWKAANSKGQIAHVPNTIVKEITNLDVSSNFNNVNDKQGRDWVRMERQGKKGEFRYF